ncbi:MAG: roadblock/LC7 domain-containing protein [Deltaproteobacteria bacterium]|nr:roadblock/LC7 domain-containing protein [Deltaproteobacteria bacterium]
MPFKKILKELTEKTGASGAILLDRDGEAVDSFVTSSGLELKAIGAHKGIILNMLKDAQNRANGGGEVCSIGITTKNARLAISAMKDGYYLVVTLERENGNGSFGKVFLEAKKAIGAIEREMG